MNPPRLLRTVLAWPVETQLGARRNALVASTALTALRREREDVEGFLAALGASPQGSHEPQHRRQHVI